MKNNIVKNKAYTLNIVIVTLAILTGCTQNGLHTETSKLKHPTDTLIIPTGDAQLDSLLQLAATAPQDTNLARLYFDIGEIYINNNAQKAAEYYLKLKDLSEKADWNKGHYLFAVGYTDILNRAGQMDSSIIIHQQVLELAEKENNEQQIAKILANIANCYNHKRWYETALKYYQEALVLFEKQGDTMPPAQLYYLIGTVYNSMNMQEENLLYCEKALNLFNEKPDELFRAYALINYAVALNKRHENEKAEKCLLEAQRICILHNNEYSLGDIYTNLCDVAHQQCDLDKMEMYARKALAVFKEFEDIEGECLSNRSLGCVEEYRGNFDKSEKYVKEALETAIEYDYQEEIMKCYALLADISIARHDFRTCRFYIQKVESNENVLITEKARLYAKEMEAKYETEKKELEIERQQHTISRQNMQRRLLMAGIAICVLILVLLWYILRLRTRRNLALTEMNATKDKFFNIISHDMKNPAIAQRDALLLLVKNANQWNTDTLIQYYAELLKSAEGQVELIYNLLGWAQLQTGRMTCTPATFNLAVRLRSDISLIQNMTVKKDIAFNVRIPEDADINGDSNMISTVIRNLMTNAVKFTATGGTVTLSVEPANEGKYTVSVSDTGIGISSEQIGKLFRIDSTRSRQGTAGEQGTGLGLIVCKEMLEKHGSILHVESEVGKGSRFWFVI